MPSGTGTRSSGPTSWRIAWAPIGANRTTGSSSRIAETNSPYASVDVAGATGFPPPWGRVPSRRRAPGSARACRTAWSPLHGPFLLPGRHARPGGQAGRVQVLGGVSRVRLGAGEGEPHGRLDGSFHFGVDPLPHAVRYPPGLQRQRVAGLPASDLLQIAVPRPSFVLEGVMAVEPVGAELQERRPLAGAGAGHAAGHRRVHGLWIHAVDGLRGDPECLGPPGDGAGHARPDRGCGPGQVVLADECPRDLPHRGQLV